jgi:hypothetical protein
LQFQSPQILQLPLCLRNFKFDQAFKMSLASLLSLVALAYLPLIPAPQPSQSLSASPSSTILAASATASFAPIVGITPEYCRQQVAKTVANFTKSYTAAPSVNTPFGLLFDGTKHTGAHALYILVGMFLLMTCSMYLAFFGTPVDACHRIVDRLSAQPKVHRARYVRQNSPHWLTY